MFPFLSFLVLPFVVPGVILTIAHILFWGKVFKIDFAVKHRTFAHLFSKYFMWHVLVTWLLVLLFVR